jgi:hypothetical protein
MLRAFNEEFLAAVGTGGSPGAEAAACDRMTCLMHDLGAGGFAARTFVHPILFDRAEVDELGRAAAALLRAQVKILEHLRATRSDEAVLELFAMPRRLLPFMRWENLRRPEETVARLDVIPSRTGYHFCELNVFPGVGGGEAYRGGELYLEALGYPRDGLPPCPLRTLAALYAGQTRRRDLARVVILESVKHAGLGYPRQELLQRYLREAHPGITVEIHDEASYPAAWLTRAEGERTLVHRMFTYEEVTDDFAFLEKLWQSGAAIAGFESDLRMSKRFLALMCDPAYQALLDREELAVIERYLPHSFALSDATLASALRDRGELVFKWDDAASYGGTGVLVGAEQPAAELEQRLRAGGVDHWICQRAIEAETLPLRAIGDAEPLEYRLVLGLFSYGGTPSGITLRGSRASRVVNASSPTGRRGWAFAVSEDTRRALVGHARARGRGTL